MKHLYHALGTATKLEGVISVFNTQILTVVARDALDAEICMLQMLSNSYPDRQYKLEGFTQVDFIASAIIEAHKNGEM